MLACTCFPVQDVVEGTEGHELGDDDEVGRLVAGSKHRQDVGVVEDPTSRQHMPSVYKKVF